ncbi:MAG: carboxylating nicotinate-nucleotide diphosphorylase [Nitrosomonadaceae bacterium]|jgi:nicotinate-nucleotide pyrophosphorylase (carboxylating)|nr:carboxylating nicotinate-nucleotide diphosphorylase [Nitrosomonadaceae bacterium]
MDLNSEISNNVAKSLSEDIGEDDLTALLIKSEVSAVATVICREKSILCGTQWFDTCFKQLSPQTEIHWFAEEGDVILAGQELCKIKGNARSLLTAERSALNFLQTLSAIATQTKSYVDEVLGTGALIVDTRKTLPGLRLAQKHAVRCGGGLNHRLGLYDGILIKENHIISAGGIESALKTAELIAPKGLIIQIEVETRDELFKALNAGARMILLDNFSLEDLSYAVTLTADLTNKETLLEASGGITLKNVKKIAETGVDRISIGSITKHVRAIDFSMNFIN